MIQHATINNLAFGRNIEETLRILQALQYVQENPDEVRRHLQTLQAPSIIVRPHSISVVRIPAESCAPHASCIPPCFKSVAVAVD